MAGCLEYSCPYLYMFVRHRLVYICLDEKGFAWNRCNWLGEHSALCFIASLSGWTRGVTLSQAYIV